MRLGTHWQPVSRDGIAYGNLQKSQRGCLAAHGAKRQVVFYLGGRAEVNTCLGGRARDRGYKQ